MRERITSTYYIRAIPAYISKTYALSTWYQLLTVVTFLLCTGCRNNPDSKENEIPPYDSISLIIQEMGARDQTIRLRFIDSLDHHNPDRIRIMNSIREVDSLNVSQLVQILEAYGWPAESKVGHQASEDVFIIIQHSKTDVMEKYFPQLKKLAEQGEASKVNAAMMEDRLRMRKGKKQIYGSQISTALDTNHSRLVWPIENPSIVDSLRRAVGFDLSVRENAQRLNAVYDSMMALPIFEESP